MTACKYCLNPIDQHEIWCIANNERFAERQRTLKILKESVAKHKAFSESYRYASTAHLYEIHNQILAVLDDIIWQVEHV